MFFIFWDTSTSSQVSNCDGVVLEIYFRSQIPVIQIRVLQIRLTN